MKMLQKTPLNLTHQTCFSEFNLTGSRSKRRRLKDNIQIKAEFRSSFFKVNITILEH